MNQNKSILISWIATNNDFIKENNAPITVKPDGTTTSFHEHFFGDRYERHLILSASRGDDTGVNFLLNYLKKHFPDHQVEARYLNVADIINMEQIRAKIEPILYEFRDRPIDLFISPGTPAMHTAWVMAHMTLGLQTRLLQVRPPRFTRSKKPELVVVDIDKDAMTSSAVVRQSRIDHPSVRDDLLLTESIRTIYEKAAHIAQAPKTRVLIIGETGTGKEHLARFIHGKSPRREEAFVAINCSAMGDDLLESRLFGYKKGAFTGADKDKPGLIQEADGGTVFLDEIGDISPYMQQALLRVLQEGEIHPIGGQAVNVDVRFIAATNKNLLKMCEEGKFRWDLYYRLSVIDLELPSLRKKGQKELKELLQYFIKEGKKNYFKNYMIHIPADVMEKILSYPFPGNIRELENLVERLYVLSPAGQVRMKDLPSQILNPPRRDSLLLVDIEKWHIEKVLKRNKGRQRKTARDIGVAYNTLMKKITEYGIDIGAFKM